MNQQEEGSKLWMSVWLLVAGLGVAIHAPAQPLRQHQAHVHGEAAGNLTLDGEDLRLELTLPGVNLAGFEHPPRDQHERDRLAAVRAQLEGGTWLTLDDRGRCQQVLIDVGTHGFDESGIGDDPAHHSHDHDHDHDRHHEHAEFHLQARWRCERPAALRWIEVDLFGDYPGNDRIVLDVLTEQTARRARLEPGRIRASLAP